jgi:hypothetical protein
MARMRHTNRPLVRHVVCAKGNHLLDCITFDKAGLESIPVTTVMWGFKAQNKKIPTNP